MRGAGQWVLMGRGGAGSCGAGMPVSGAVRQRGAVR